MNPGIYRNYPASDYHALKMASNSYLGALKRSPAHCRCAMDEPHDPSPAMRMGEAVHFAVLQPDLFGAQYARLPAGDGRTAAIKAARADLATRYREDRILSGTDYDICVRVRDAVWAHAAAKNLLSRLDPGDIEVTGVWRDGESGVLCKMRSDGFIGDNGIIIDLKTTENASHTAFTRSIFNFAYYRQGAMYLSGLAALTHVCEHFVFIAVEKQPPYACAVYRLEDDVLEVGRDEIRELLGIYAECERTGHWPGYGDQIQGISLPAFAWRELLREAV